MICIELTKKTAEKLISVIEGYGYEIADNSDDVLDLLDKLKIHVKGEQMNESTKKELHIWWKQLNEMQESMNSKCNFLKRRIAMMYDGDMDE